MKASKTKKPLIIAHRGAKSLAKHENTMEAFQIAIDYNIQMIEFDVRKTKDNKLVVFHNNHIHGVKLYDLDYDDLCRESWLDGYTIPLLSEVLKLCRGHIKLDIELKESGFEGEFLEQIDEYFSFDDLIVTSFLDKVLIELKRINPNIKTGLLIGLEKATVQQRFSELFPLKRLKKTCADFIVPNYRLVNRYLLYICNKYKYGIFVWTVNTHEIYKKIHNFRVTGIITDYPQRYINNSLYSNC